MYPITEEQINYILDDIRRNGIHMEDLQLNLLDHICCLLEQTLKEEDDFEASYHQTVQQFYLKELREIEEETIRLITFKNYFMMKKIMMAAGAFSTFTFLFGSLFKIMHWQGASMLMTLAVLIFCLFFLPLLFILKSKEVNTGLEKLVVALGTALGIIFCLSILFKVQHWPGATLLLFLMIGFSFFVFIPMYFFTGYRKPETRINTMLTTVLLIGFTTVTFLSVNLKGLTTKQVEEWTSYSQTEMIWQKVNAKNHISDESNANTVIKCTDDLKMAILDLTATKSPQNYDVIPSDLKVDNLGYLGRADGYNKIGMLLKNLQNSVKKYNEAQLNDASKIPDGFAFIDASAKEFSQMENIFVLNTLTQLQIYLISASSEKTVVVR